MQEQTSETRSDPLLEQKIGQYSLIQLIGIGATARVYRAKDTQAGDAEVAVKILSDAIALDPAQRRGDESHGSYPIMIETVCGLHLAGKSRTSHPCRRTVPWDSCSGRTTGRFSRAGRAG